MIICADVPKFKFAIRALVTMVLVMSFAAAPACAVNGQKSYGAVNVFENIIVTLWPAAHGNNGTLLISYVKPGSIVIQNLQFDLNATSLPDVERITSRGRSCGNMHLRFAANEKLLIATIKATTQALIRSSRVELDALRKHLEETAVSQGQYHGRAIPFDVQFVPDCTQ